MRKDGVWSVGPGGKYIQTGAPLGYDLLLNGTSHYINFNTIVGVNGYGFRDNGGVIEFKNSGGAWTPIGSGTGSGVTLETNGTLNGSQTVLNLISGTGISLSDDGVGGVTITATGAGGYWTRNAGSGFLFPTTLTDKVGIGTNAPAYMLDISGGTTGALRLTNSSNSPYALMINDTAFGSTDVKGLGIYQNTNGEVHFVNNNNDSFRITSAGLVGVGNNTPTAPLHVFSSTTSTVANTAIFEQDGGGIGIIQLGNAAPSQNAKFTFNFAADNLLTIATNYSAGTNNAIAFAPGGTETVRFKQGGLNGFGTNAPTHAITLSSTATTGIAAYNTTDQVTNYERAVSSWVSNVYTIQTQNGGTGTLRNMNIFGGGNNIFLGGDATGAGIAVRRNGTSIGTLFSVVSDGLSASGSVQNGISIVPTIIQTSTAGYNMLFISPFESTVGSANKYLINAGTNSAANGNGTHTIKFSVLDSGVVSMNFDNSHATTFAPDSSGNMTITPSGGSTSFAGTISGGTASSNIIIQGATTAASASAAQYQYASSTTNFFRTGFYGSASSIIPTGSNYAGVIFANAPITTFTSGTHSWLANVVVKPLGTVTSGGATVTNTASLFIDGAGTGGTNNYALYVNSGNSFFGGNITTSGTILTSNITSLGGSAAAEIQTTTTGTIISRNTADANTTLAVNNSNASATGLILDTQFVGTSRFAVGKAGDILLGGSAGTATFVLTSAGAGAPAVWSPASGAGGITRSVNTISTATGAGSTAATDYVYFVSGTTTLTLPTAVGNTNQYTVKRTDATLVTTIATTSAQTIDGASTFTLSTQYESVSLISNGSNWLIV